MAETRDWLNPLSDVEALVRGARDYVHASEDLRPRVLETARAECCDERARGFLRQMALAIVLWSLCAAPGMEYSQHHPQLALVTNDAQRRVSEAAAHSATQGEFGWSMVEAFTELRRQQAEALNRAL